jgi:Uma2 family endonuclease
MLVREVVPVERDIAGNILYPESDGLPVANNTEHLDWITYLHHGLTEHFRDDPQVFVASDLFWYPVEGNPSVRFAPDVMVVFGVPKGRRGSYRQWNEGGIAPQVVFEILSPGNTVQEMLSKQAFYSAFGVEEYFVYDCEHHHLQIWLRSGSGPGLQPVPEDRTEGWTSPRLRMRFWVHSEDGLTVELPDGTAMESYAQVAARRRQAEAARAAAEAARTEAEAARAKAEAARAEAEAARDRLAAKLRELGVDPDQA